MENNTILILDDDADFLRLVERKLALTGRYKISAFSNPDDVFAAAEDLFPHVVLTDYMMPGRMNGFDFIKRARLIWPQSVYIMMTAFPSLSSTLEAINHTDVFRFLVKPMEDEKLYQAVSEAFAYYSFNARFQDLSSRLPMSGSEPLRGDQQASASMPIRASTACAARTTSKTARAKRTLTCSQPE